MLREKELKTKINKFNKRENQSASLSIKNM